MLSFVAGSNNMSTTMSTIVHYKRLLCPVFLTLIMSLLQIEASNSFSSTTRYLFPVAVTTTTTTPTRSNRRKSSNTIGSNTSLSQWRILGSNDFQVMRQHGWNPLRGAFRRRRGGGNSNNNINNNNNHRNSMNEHDQWQQPVMYASSVSIAMPTTAESSYTTSSSSEDTAINSSTTAVPPKPGNRIFSNFVQFLSDASPMNIIRQRQRQATVEKAPLKTATTTTKTLTDTFSATATALPKLKHQQAAVESFADWHLRRALTEPIMDSETFDNLHGDEWIKHYDSAQHLWLDDLAHMGHEVALQSPQHVNPWIAWKSTSSGNDKDVQVWTGTSKVQGHGSQAPWIKTKSIIPNMTPKQLVDLLLDSSRVTTYNPWSLGRQDVWTPPPDNDNDDDDVSNSTASGRTSIDDSNNESASSLFSRRQITKIVQNRSKPPLGNKLMVATTLLHARPVDDQGSWIVVSRAVGGKYWDKHLKKHNNSDSSNTKQYSKSDICLGVNLIEPKGTTDCTLTAVTHVYTTLIPGILAERLGVKSAVQFVKDIRASVNAAAATANDEPVVTDFEQEAADAEQVVAD